MTRSNLPLDSLQRFLSANESVGQAEGGVILAGCGLAVTLLFQQLPQHTVSLENGAFFDGGAGKILAQQLYGESGIASGAQEDGASVHERLGAVHGAGLHGSQG